MLLPLSNEKNETFINHHFLHHIMGKNNLMCLLNNISLGTGKSLAQKNYENGIKARVLPSKYDLKLFTTTFTILTALLIPSKTYFKTTSVEAYIPKVFIQTFKPKIDDETLEKRLKLTNGLIKGEIKEFDITDLHHTNKRRTRILLLESLHRKKCSKIHRKKT